MSGSEAEARRWTREYRHLLVNEEITSLENVSDTGSLQQLAMRLPELVGSPLSLNSLREDLQVSHKTITRWVDIFERMYMIFRLAPLGSPKIRAVKKEQKHYLVETKSSDKAISPSLVYLKRKFPEADAYQILLAGDRDYFSGEGIRLMPAVSFLGELM